MPCGLDLITWEAGIVLTDLWKVKSAIGWSMFIQEGWE